MENFSQSGGSLDYNNNSQHHKSKCHAHNPNHKSSKKRDKISLHRFLEMKQKSEELVIQNRSQDDDNDTWGHLGSVAFSNDTWGRLESGAFSPSVDDDLGACSEAADEQKEEEQEQEQDGQEIHGYLDDDDESVHMSLSLDDIEDDINHDIDLDVTGHTKLSQENSMVSLMGDEEIIISQSLSLSLDDMNQDMEDDDDDYEKDKDNELTTEQVTDFAVADPAGKRATYTGAISKASGMPCGQGRLTYADTGEIFEGQFVHGLWTGYGRCIYTITGEDYTGYFLNNIKHGHGVTKHQDGRIFEGAYSFGVKTEGKMTYKDGSTYLGKWFRGARHGRGTYTFLNGSVFFGEFRDDRMHGSGVLNWTNGSRYIGQWRNGVRHGLGKEFKSDGSVRREGPWKDGSFIVVG
jgi:hypothetical protein